MFVSLFMTFKMMCHLILVHLVYRYLFTLNNPYLLLVGGGVPYVKKYLLKFAKARWTTLPQNIAGESRKSTYVRNFLLLCEFFKSVVGEGEYLLDTLCYY